MRTALCLFGIVGGRSGKDGSGGDVDFKLCFEHYKKYILKPNQTDVFIHTWSVQHQKAISDLYQPKGAIFERQITFDKSPDLHRSKSRWYSTKQVINLKKQYEDKHNFKYDYVMVGRFDLMWLRHVKFQEYDPQYFYVSNWNEYPRMRNVAQGESVVDKTNRSMKTKRFLDLWFFSNSEIMDYFGNLYDVINNLGCGNLDQHRLVWNYMMASQYKDKIKYEFYRWIDYELYRWKVLGCYK